MSVTRVPLRGLEYTVLIGTGREKRCACFCHVLDAAALIGDDDAERFILIASGDEGDRTHLFPISVDDAVGHSFAHGATDIGKLLHVGVERKKKTRNDASCKRFIFGFG